MGNPERMVQNGENALEVTEGSLLDQIVSQTRMNPGDEGYDVAKRGDGGIRGPVGLRSTDRHTAPDGLDVDVSQYNRAADVGLLEVLGHGILQQCSGLLQEQGSLVIKQEPNTTNEF